MRPVDAHCHLDFEQYEDDREEVIERAREKLEFVANAGSSPENNEKVIELKEKYPEFIVSGIGLHPTYTESFDRVPEVKQQIKSHDPEFIGEIGLDYHHVEDEDLRDKQRDVFERMISTAEELEKPVVVHSRNAEKDAVDILIDRDIPVMLHAFNGRPELAEKAAEQGLKIGITTQVLYSTRVQNIVKALNIDDLLLETDSPFLYQGDRNEPANVVRVGRKVADLKGLEIEQVFDVTTDNAKEFFQV